MVSRGSRDLARAGRLLSVYVFRARGVVAAVNSPHLISTADRISAGWVSA